MERRALQIFFVAIFLLIIHGTKADLVVGKIYSLKFTDVDGNTLSTTDGRVSLIVLVTRQNVAKSQLVGDRVPDRCIGNPAYQIITVVRFGQHSAPVRALLRAGARIRLNTEAKRVQPRYDANRITRDPRRDIFAVADFDGAIATQLGARPDVTFRAFIFGRSGELLAQWDTVPSIAELDAVLK